MTPTPEPGGRRVVSETQTFWRAAMPCGHIVDGQGQMPDRHDCELEDRLTAIEEWIKGAYVETTNSATDPAAFHVVRRAVALQSQEAGE
jgi:hypothetical protein